MLDELLATELAKLNAAACAATTNRTADDALTMNSNQNTIRQVHASTKHDILHSESQPTTTYQAIDHNAAVHSLVHPTAAPPNLTQAAPSAAVVPEMSRVEHSIPHISTGLNNSSTLRINYVNPPEIESSGGAHCKECRYFPTSPYVY